MPPPPGEAPRVGELVAGARLTALVGRGGSGQVWAATEEPGGARVAVKLLDRSGAEREAQLLAGLRHPHVLPLRRVAHDPPAVVTDLAEGGSLQAQVQARGCLTAGEVATVVAPLADALAFLHGRGVVHGDVSGTNVLFVGRGRPVLADLGSATLAGVGEASATPGYAAPEVLAGARPGPASDVHGLGAVAWLALTGGVPPSAEDRLPLRLLAPECPDALAEVVTAALDPDPAARPAPEDLAGEVRLSCTPCAVRLVPGAALGVRAEEAVTYRVRLAAADDPAPARSPRRRPGRRSALAGAVVAGVAAAVTTGVLLAPTLRPDATGTGPAVPSGPDALPLAADPAAPATSGAPASSDGAEDGDGGSPGGDPVPLGGGELVAQVTALVAARQEALRTGDPAALGRVHHPDGDTLARDRALLGAGPVPVGYEVIAVTPVPGRPGVATVLTRTTGAGREVTEEVVVELGLADGGWRVLAVQG